MITIETRNQNKVDRIRRSRSIIAYWKGQEFIVENYLSQKYTVLSPLISGILQRLDNYVTRNELFALFRTIPSSKDIIEQLISQNILVIKGSDLDNKEFNLENTWKWGDDARYFHYSTQHTVFEHNREVVKRKLIRLAKVAPAPSPFKNYNGRKIKLTSSFNKSEGDPWNTLYIRRTKRSFKRKPISMESFSTLLLWTWGKSHLISKSDIGKYILKTSPSGGARHPIEVYPVVLRVQNIVPGIYHYSVKNHELEEIKLGDFEEHVVNLCANQDWIRNAAVVFFMTAMVQRSMWKYQQSHAYRVLLLDAGHIGQTFHLVCTKLGLAPFTTAATYDPKIEEVIDIDGVQEIPVYTAATGIPSNASEQQLSTDQDFKLVPTPY